jgi:hypothetical protein
MIGPDLDNIHNAKMVVSDLRDGGIGLSDCPKHLNDRGVLHPPLLRRPWEC